MEDVVDRCLDSQRKQCKQNVEFQTEQRCFVESLGLGGPGC